MKGTKERKLSAIQATNLRDLKKEVQRGALYIVPEGPLKPLIRTQEEDTGHSSNRLATSSENEARRISKRENQSTKIAVVGEEVVLFYKPRESRVWQKYKE